MRIPINIVERNQRRYPRRGYPRSGYYPPGYLSRSTPFLEEERMYRDQDLEPDNDWEEDVDQEPEPQGLRASVDQAAEAAQSTEQEALDSSMAAIMEQGGIEKY